MSRELIVSVNGREKKIAIVEDERVTEFYIERGEQNQGIVGNLYKGRVMRVLPGMQSAFVDIGLERDAFLYVSDFFDEEAEFEKIVVDAGKKGDPAAQQTAAAKIEQSRIEREHHIEATHERVDPLLEAEGEISTTAESPEEETEETGTRRRGRRGGRGRRRTTKAETVPEREERSIIPHAVEPFDTPFVSAASFERVSDDEGLVNGEMLKDARLQERIMDEVHAAEFDLEDVPSAPVGSLLSEELRESGEFQRVADPDDADVAAARPPAIEEAHVRSFIDEVVDESSRGPAFQRVSDDEEAAVNLEASTEAPPSSTRSRKKSGVISRLFKSKKSDEASEETSSEENQNEVNPDAEASIDTGRVHEEFATRRGGRRRRRPKAGGTGEAADGQDESADVTDAPSVAPEEAAIDPPAPEAEVEAGAPAENGEEAPRATRRPAPRGRRRNPRHERKQPTISDLLREGQEILVQIAKEPIAKKGARITSHIALPGRFCVYMPTVEHLGVSRKIDSDTERSRLRKLIQKIHAEEDVPSGGFIVRTAGVGASEADLRADARYLIRTWQDIRQGAEKAKAPALIHRDLDLVQRILRDQLAEDFSAIRIDSEDEYQRVVEFVNRMQPKLVNRVKLYTRDEPILEQYGVQGEIDKAIKPRVWLKSGGYLVINQTEALVSFPAQWDPKLGIHVT